jgi:hypothetical protein
VFCLFCWMWLGIASLPSSRRSRCSLPLCLPDTEHVPPAVGPASPSSQPPRVLLPAARASQTPSTLGSSRRRPHCTPPRFRPRCSLLPAAERAVPRRRSCLPDAVHAAPRRRSFLPEPCTQLPPPARAACSSPIGHAAGPLRKALLSRGFGREPVKKMIKIGRNNVSQKRLSISTSFHRMDSHIRTLEIYDQTRRLGRRLYSLTTSPQRIPAKEKENNLDTL